MAVRAKFKVESIERQMTSRRTKDTSGAYTNTYEPAEMQTVKLSPVYGGNDPNHENAKFWEATPSGRLELGCINLEAAQMFELDKEYYLDIFKAE